MKIPKKRIARPFNTRRPNRKGAVLPMFAMLLPAVFILCGLAINTAHLRLVKMEMKIATDAAAHAGGRSMSIHQTTEDALATAQEIGAMNLVGGQPLSIDIAQDADFGFSVRKNNGFGRYGFTSVNREAVDNLSLIHI